MRHHRFPAQLEALSFRRRQQPTIFPGAFLAYPVVAGAGGPVSSCQQLYQLAWMHAQAVHQPSLPDRLSSVASN